MKGIVFTEFMEMVEEKWSLDMADVIIQRAAVPSKGAYTAVGTYPHEEMMALVAALAQETGMAASDLIRAFGAHMFQRFHKLYPRFFEGVSGSFQLLAGIEHIIHAEVRKLYPDAELPTFEVEEGPGSLTLTYHSRRHFADLVEGLIRGCVEHYGEAIEVTRETPREGGAQARFVLRNRERT